MGSVWWDFNKDTGSFMNKVLKIPTKVSVPPPLAYPATGCLGVQGGLIRKDRWGYSYLFVSFMLLKMFD